jgi:flagellar L-ring protein precursor FlgH
MKILIQKPAGISRRIACVVGLAVLAASATAQEADSLHNYGSLYPAAGTIDPLAKRTAHRKGDVLTIVVNENSASNVTANTTATKTDTNSISPMSSPILSWLNVPVLTSLLGGASNGANSSVAGTGTSTNNQTFTAMIAVVVKDVTPQGNLLIEGTKWIQVNKEQQNLTLTGIVRADDVQADNTVLSQNVANAQIKCEGKGLVADRQRKGFLTQIMEWLF